MGGWATLLASPFGRGVLRKQDGEGVLPLQGKVSPQVTDGASFPLRGRWLASARRRGCPLSLRETSAASMTPRVLLHRKRLSPTHEPHIQNRKPMATDIADLRNTSLWWLHIVNRKVFLRSFFLKKTDWLTQTINRIQNSEHKPFCKKPCKTLHLHNRLYR